MPPLVKTHHCIEHYTKCSNRVCQRKRQLSAAANDLPRQSGTLFSTAWFTLTPWQPPKVAPRSCHPSARRWQAKNARRDEPEPSAEWPASGPNSDVQRWEQGWREVLATGEKHKNLFHRLIFHLTPYPPPHPGRLAKSQHTQRAPPSLCIDFIVSESQIWLGLSALRPSQRRAFGSADWCWQHRPWTVKQVTS